MPTTSPAVVVSSSSGNPSSTDPGGRVPRGVGVKRLCRGLSSFTLKLHALRSNVLRSANGTSQETARARLLLRPRELRNFAIYTTITYALRAFNYPAGRTVSCMVT